MRLFTYFILLVSVTSIPTEAQDRFTDTYADAIESLLQDKFADSSSGMVIGLLDEHGSRLFSSGKLDNGSNGTVNGDTVFEIGSVTKIFTALLLQDAVRRGELQFEEPLENYLPEAVTVPSYNGRKISLLNLAVQDSGLPHFPDNLSEKPLEELSLKEVKEFSDAYTVEDMYRFLSDYKLPQEPGATFQYSNVGMALLGHVIEKKTGTSYEALVSERICHPLKMQNTRITLNPEDESRLARGHFVDGTRSEHIHFQAFASAGSILSTANDLLKFLSANLGVPHVELTPLLKNMQVIRHKGSSQFGRTAMPWVDNGVYNPPGSELLGHSGGGMGTIAFIAIDKKKRRGVVVLTNQMKVNPNGIGWTLLQGLPLTAENISYAVREVIGVGFALDKDEKTGQVQISKVFPDSPAGRAGLTVGLILREVDGNVIEGKTLAECFALLKGPAGKSVHLTFRDQNANKTLAVELTRGKFLTTS